MIERAAWSNWLQPMLHSPKNDRVAWKIQDKFRQGIPDILGHVGGHTYLAEHKHISKRPKRPTTPIRVTLSVGQCRHLEDWGGLKRRAYVFVTLESPREIAVLDPSIFKGGIPTAFTRDGQETLFYGLCDRSGLRTLVEFLAGTS